MPSGSSAFWVSDLHGMDSHSISTRRASWLYPRVGQVAGRPECGAASNGQEPLRPRAGGGYRLGAVQPASNHPGPAHPSDDDDAGPLSLLRHLGQHQTIALVRLSGRQDLEEMVVASGSSASAPLGSTE